MDRLAARKEPTARLDLIGLEERIADRGPLRGQEREAHRATHHERVDDGQERVDHSQLVADLRSAQHRDERVARMVTHAEQHLDLTCEQAAGSARQRARRTDDRGVGPVRGAEGVVDIDILAGDQLLDELRVACLLAGIEPQVLEQLDGGCQLRKPRSHGSHRVALVRPSLRAPEMAARGDVGALLREPFDRRERGSDAVVVDDLACLDGDVEVRAKQDLLAARDRGGLRGAGASPGGARAQLFAAPTISARSTSRFE